MNILDHNIKQKELVRPVDIINQIAVVLITISSMKKSLIKLTKTDYDVINNSIDNIKDIIDLTKQEEL